MVGDGRGCRKRRPQAFPYPCSDGSRTRRMLCSDIAFDVLRKLFCLCNVRPAHTACARTGGHLISEKPAASVFGIPCFLAVVCCLLFGCFLYCVFGCEAFVIKCCLFLKNSKTAFVRMIAVYTFFLICAV